MLRAFSSVVMVALACALFNMPRGCLASTFKTSQIELDDAQNGGLADAARLSLLREAC